MPEVAASWVTVYPKLSQGFVTGLKGDVAKAMAAAGTAPVQGSAFEKAGREQGKKFGAGFGSGAKALLTGAVATTALSYIRSATDSFAELQDASAAAGVVFGASMGKIEAASASAAEQFGVSKKEYVDGAITMGTFGKAAGLTGNDLAEFSSQMVQTAADMASFRGTTPTEAIEAVGAALRGESEPIRKYGVLLDDASLRQEALRQGLVKTTKDALTPQQRVLAAQALILKQTADAQGDFARTANSTANVQKRLAAETENFNAAMGERLAPTVVEVQQGLSNLLGVTEDNIAVFAPFTDTALALATAFNDLTRAMNGGTEAGKALKPLLDSLNNISLLKPVQDLANAYVGWSKSTNATTSAVKDNATATDDSTGSTKRNTGAVEDNAAALKENAKKLNDVYGARLKLRGDKRALEAAFNDATAAAKKNGKTLDENTPKGRANAAALDDIAQTALSVKAAMEEQGASTSEVDDVMGRARSQFIKVATAMTGSSAKAKDLADKLGLIKSPKPVKVKVTWDLPGPAKVKFEGGEYTVKAPGGRYASGGKLPGFASSDRDDRFPLASGDLGVPGEWVIRRAAVRKYGDGAMAAVNAGRAQIRYADGGQIGSASASPIKIEVHGPNADEVAARTVARVERIWTGMAVQS